MLTRRLQVLIDDERYERLKREAERRKEPIGRLVREAIDRAIPHDSARRADALQRILEAPPTPVPDDPQDLEREIEVARRRAR